MKVAVIPADKEAPVRVEEVETINLAYLQKQVGGYIEVIDVNAEDEPELSMYLNEEGKLAGLPYNARASYLAQDSIMPFDVIVGDVVMTGGVDEEGESTGLTEEQVATLLKEFETTLARIAEREKKMHT